MSALHVLPPRGDSATANIAADFLLLQRYPVPAVARFRHYEWQRPAFTFGFSQKIEFIRAAVESAQPVELCRRPTGGGLVDHRDDWTYALVVPRAHALYDLRAVESYRLVHEALAEALQAGGAAAEVKTQCQPSGEEGCAGLAGVCFGRAELYDVVHSRSGLKIAGAAQKRSKHGLLFEGSIARSVAGEVAWDEWEEIFVAQLERRLQLTATPSGWPDWDDEHQALTEHYASPEWLEHR